MTLRSPTLRDAGSALAHPQSHHHGQEMCVFTAHLNPLVQFMAGACRVDENALLAAISVFTASDRPHMPLYGPQMPSSLMTSLFVICWAVLVPE